MPNLGIIFAGATDVVLYFFMCRLLVKILLTPGFINNDYFHALFVLLIIIFLASVSYLGAWATIAGKRDSVFWKVFIAFDIIPGVLGAISVHW